MTRRQNRLKRRFKLLNQFLPVTMIASTTLGTYNPRISAQTVTNRLREIGERHPYTMYVLYEAFLFGLVYIERSNVKYYYNIVILSLKIDADPDELLHYKGWSTSPSFVSILALIKHISKYIPCANPESFVRGGPTLTRVSVC